MRVRSFFALAAVSATAFAAFAGIPAASAATTVQVTVADMYTYSSSQPLNKTICIDGVGTNSGAPELHGPSAMQSGDHELKVFVGLDQDCTDGDANIDETITISEDPFQTIFLYWPSNSGPQVSVLSDDISCPAAGTGRIVYRPGAAVGEGDPNTDLGYGDFVPFVEDVEVGSQGAAEVAPATYDDWNAIIHGDGMVVDGPASGDVAAAGTIFVYTYGGNDGGTGMLVLPEIACTPVTPPPTPPAPAPQVVAKPAFTG
jgi:hypothetical protein